MYVSDLSLDDFRSYHNLVLSLEPGPSAFVGSNGQGKTNLIEAIVYLATLSSHRIGADTALVRRAVPGQSQPAGAVVRARTVHGERPSVLEIEIIAGRANRARLNRGQARPRDLLGVLRTVVFTFDAGQVLTEHSSPRAVIVTLLEGEMDFSIGERTERMGAGDVIYLAPGDRHALTAVTPCRMQLVMVDVDKAAAANEK